MTDTTTDSTAPSEQDLIEIAAESMWHAYRRTPEFRRPWETCAEDDKEVYRNKARAAIVAIRPHLESQHAAALAARDAEVARKIISEINELYQGEPEIHESEYEKGYWQGIGEVWELVFAHAPKCLHCQGDRTVVVNRVSVRDEDVFEKCPHCNGVGMEPATDLSAVDQATGEGRGE